MKRNVLVISANGAVGSAVTQKLPDNDREIDAIVFDLYRSAPV